ncbi:MAG: hypothetical protein KME16_18895 [Scytolyngbya sp. HA4215-MV1]|jgi:hypothetical protein|nr:hypothetical protein [Scytolyngbya sp. HA4215-MV1]
MPSFAFEDSLSTQAEVSAFVPDSSSAAVTTAPLRQRLELQSALAQFRARYPTGSLTAELLQIHTNHYVVRAEVQVGGLTIASGMAAANQIELAEDQARLRALAVVGIQPELATQALLPVIPLVSTQAPVEAVLPTAEAILTNLTKTEKPIATPLPAIVPSPSIAPEVLLPSVTASPLPTPNLPVPEPDTLSPKPDKVAPPSLDEALPIAEALPSDLESDWSPNWDSDLESNLTPDFAADQKPDLETSQTPAWHNNVEAAVVTPPKTSAGNGKPVSRSQKAGAEKSPSPEPASNQEPVDFSDPIAQIDTEMMRVGWTKEQGRDHLKKTYKKRSRQQLSDEELLDFLSHLKSLPSSSQTPF